MNVYILFNLEHVRFGVPTVYVFNYLLNIWWGHVRSHFKSKFFFPLIPSHFNNLRFMCFCSIGKVSIPSFSTGKHLILWSRLHSEDSIALEQRRSWVQQVEPFDGPGGSISGKWCTFPNKEMGPKIANKVKTGVAKRCIKSDFDWLFLGLGCLWRQFTILQIHSVCPCLSWLDSSGDHNATILLTNEWEWQIEMGFPIK